MTEATTTALAVPATGQLSTAAMAARLGEMKAQIDLVHEFFQTVMISGEDYGVIPGTDKPTLLKPGAEKLCEFYGYTPRVKAVDAVEDQRTGYARVVVTMQLERRSDGVIIAEGVGSANTMEDRYRWRNIPSWKLPAGTPTEGLVVTSSGENERGPWYMYRMENSEPWTLWNTVLKQAKKRALVDVTMSATRSSGIFTQDTEDLRGWIEGENAERTGRADMQGGNNRGGNRGNNRNNAGGNNRQQREKDPDAVPWSSFWAACKERGLDSKLIHAAAGVESIKDWKRPQLQQLLNDITAVVGPADVTKAMKPADRSAAMVAVKAYREQASQGPQEAQQPTNVIEGESRPVEPEKPATNTLRGRLGADEEDPAGEGGYDGPDPDDYDEGPADNDGPEGWH